MAAGSHFEKKVPGWSEMARNAIESDFRSSKMAAGGHFEKEIKKKTCVLIWNGEKCDRKWFGSSKMAAGGHLVKNFQTNKSWVFIWNGEKCDRKLFLVIQND